MDIFGRSQFAFARSLRWLAQAGVPMLVVLGAVIVAGALLGAVGGALVAWLRMPSIVVTLALMVAWRDGLRWITEGEWIQNLPAGFQWFGMGQSSGQLLIIALAIIVLLVCGWALRRLSVGRSIYAVGSDAEAARLVGIEPRRIIFGVFLIMGALVGLAATLNATRFSIVPSNAGIGVELKAIAAVVVGNSNYGWPWHADRDAYWGGPTGHNRNRTDLLRNQSVLGKSDSGSDHSGRARVGCCAWATQSTAQGRFWMAG